LKQLLANISSCTICQAHLSHPPRPVLAASPQAKILLIGQAPGLKVHQSGTPWDDASGRELRRWLGVNTEQFYDTRLFALMPMGFCYPGKGPSGDLPPRPECAPAWHHLLLSEMKKVQLTLLIGQYSQQYYLGAMAKPTLTETVRCFQEYLPRYLPLVHPSPRNRIWQKKNPWFEEELVPLLQQKVGDVLIS
jgi:uracil-DNA glycosylase